MIRINLLPGEDRRRPKATITLKAGDLVVPLAVLVATALILAGTALSQYTRAENLTRSIAKVDAESRELAPQIERVNRLAQERAELVLRLGIIAEGVLAMEMGATAFDLAQSVHPHPTLSETLMECAEAFYGHATHVSTRKRQ